jgi:hypothetical protein
MIIGAVGLVVLVALVFFMSGESPEPDVTTDPAAESAPAAPAN